MRLIKYFSLLIIIFLTATSCTYEPDISSQSAQQEQERTESNQQQLNTKQPAPKVTWSLERDNLVKRFKLMNDRSVIMYMYIFNYGIEKPIGYYQVNKVSSVNSQLTNPEQVIDAESYLNHHREGSGWLSIPSPAEDGSYGENGNGIFGFTPDDIYIEHNMQYVVSTAPLNFPESPNIGKVSVENVKQLQKLMDKLDK